MYPNIIKQMLFGPSKGRLDKLRKCICERHIKWKFPKRIKTNRSEILVTTPSMTKKPSGVKKEPAIAQGAHKKD